MSRISAELPRLHLLCGKAASGKSSLSKKLAAVPATVVLVEDEWLAALFGDQMKTLADYVAFTGKLKSVMKPHIVSLLQSGLSVVLDFQANTLETRRWMREIIAESGAEHTLHYLEVSDAECKRRLKLRKLAGTHPFEVTEAQFDRLVQHFVPPGNEEGFNILVHKTNDQ